MAKIKGFEVKGIKEGFGHDGGGLSANVYFNNKKIGSIYDDGWGGGIQIDIDKQLDEFKQAAEEFKKEKRETILSPGETLVYSLVELKQYESDFKKAIKQGYEALVELDFKKHDENGNRIFDAPVPYPPVQSFFASNSAIEGLIEEKKPSKYRVFKSLDDFNIA